MIQPSSAQPAGSGPLLKGKATAFAVYVCGAGLTYLSQLVLARVIGMAAYGTYAYVLGIVTLLAYLAALGFDVSLLRFLPAYQSQQQWRLMRGVVVYAERSAAWAGGLIAAVGIAAIVAFGHVARDGTILTFAAGFGLIPVYALLWIRCARVRAFGGVASALIPDRVIRDGFVLAAVLLAALLPTGAFGAPTAMAITLLGGIAGLVTVTRAVRNQRGPQDAPARLPMDSYEPSSGEIGLWRRSIFPLVAIALAEVTVNRAGSLALTWAGSPAEAGVYALAFNLSAIVILPRVAVNTQFAPMVADRFARGDTEGVQALLNHASLWALLAAASMAAALWLVAAPLLPLVFGPAVVGALPVLGILLLGQIIASGAGSQIFLLTMSGQERLAAIVLIGFALADVAASVLLVPPFGLPGAAVATSACLVGMNIAMALLVWRRLGVKPGSFGMLAKPWTMRALSAAARNLLFRAVRWMDRRKPGHVDAPAKPSLMR
ncbi:lipopolysaccharide biosynthesis protein [Rhodopila sp.]|uniref:lipopolysaccharide biosynthesis protein n=1 Tax=Rhodopila sp. TaxID=2480087 RepID=UPI003D13DC3C